MSGVGSAAHWPARPVPPPLPRCAARRRRKWPEARPVYFGLSYWPVQFICDLLVMDNRFGIPALLLENVAKGCSGDPSIVGLDFQRHSILSDGFVHVSLSLKSAAEAVVGFRVVGLDLQRHSILSSGLVRLLAGELPGF